MLHVLDLLGREMALCNTLLGKKVADHESFFDIIKDRGEKLLSRVEVTKWAGQYIPGTKMVFPGQKKPQEQAYLIEYLKQSTA
ncbi:hypothetical protein L1987_27289 [Smallanthus sonchifolius]|uniref:Uncharacterized protein n=2 Tax=Smallanthus sonchifolius TaxID=185202 RepID=A0ACB9ICG4_9ASTR|nr:hypothetical protein L1987_27288 [Smallanthus sonchifolius]KAI3805172.1 hypothetical protein L1987_27289 [Smallanthus sonchifolius]